MTPPSDEPVDAGSDPTGRRREGEPSRPPIGPASGLQCSPYSAVTALAVALHIHPPRRLRRLAFVKAESFEPVLTEHLPWCDGFTVAEPPLGPGGNSCAEAAVAIEDEDGTRSESNH